MAGSNPLQDAVPGFLGTLLSQTCRTDGKVQPSVMVGNWQQRKAAGLTGTSVEVTTGVELCKALL